MTYQRPKATLHRGFVYLDDDAVTNSLSAMHAGDVDQVIAKMTEITSSALHGSVGANLSLFGKGVQAEGEGDHDTSYTKERELVLKRTRFSIFEAWHQHLTEKKAIGLFEGWGADALTSVRTGDTVELRAELTMQPLQALLRLYLWWYESSRKPGSIFTLSGEGLKTAKETAKLMEFLLAGCGSTQTYLEATPTGNPGPHVLMSVDQQWAIRPLGSMSGMYTIVAQVESVLEAGKTYPAMRITEDVPVTALEETTLRDALSHFREPARALGLEVSDEQAFVPGPALVLRPLGIYR